MLDSTFSIFFMERCAIARYSYLQLPRYQRITQSYSNVETSDHVGIHAKK